MQRFNRIGKLKDAFDSAAEKAQDATGKTLEKTQDVSGMAADAAASAGEKAQDTAEKTLEMAQAASRKVIDAAASAAEQAQDVAEKTLDATTEKSQTASRIVVDAAASTAGLAQDTAGKTLEVTASAASGAVEIAQAIYGKSVDTIFPECPVTAFMLPTGPNVDDYVMVFDFDDVFANLKSGIFVRPKMEVWAGRGTGFDPDRFGLKLKNDFVRQFNDARESQTRAAIRAGETVINGLESIKSHASREIGKGVTGSVLWTTAGVGLASAGFIAWPLLPLGLLFIAFGIGSMSQLVGLIPDYLSLRGETRKTQRELDRDLKRLEAQFDSKNSAFQRSVRNIEVKVHPRLREITEMICEAEGVPFSDSDTSPESGNVPDVGPYLRHSTYMNQLPTIYRPLIDPEWKEPRQRSSFFSRLKGRP